MSNETCIYLVETEYQIHRFLNAIRDAETIEYGPVKFGHVKVTCHLSHDDMVFNVTEGVWNMFTAMRRQQIDMIIQKEKKH